MYHGNRATQGVAVPETYPVDVSIPESPWVATLAGTYSTSEMSFGVGCGDTVELASVVDGGVDFSIVINVFVNDSIYDIMTLDDMSPSSSLTLNLTDYPCGNIIRLEIQMIGAANIPPTQVAIVISSIS